MRYGYVESDEELEEFIDFLKKHWKQIKETHLNQRAYVKTGIGPSYLKKYIEVEP
jgi:hypothetical protein